jgi:hypothetical protein
LKYEQTHKDSQKSEILKAKDIKTTRHVLELKPEQSGTYVYSFLSIGDSNYGEGIDLVDQAPITHIIHPQSTASFRDTRPDKILKCIGDKVMLPVVLSGSKPWKLTVSCLLA